MQIYLYDSMATMPQDEGNHILVYAGLGSLLKSEATGMLTEVLCTYRIGDTSIEFPRNGDAESVRFEQALSWAAKYAKGYGIDKVHGIFELERPLDYQYLNRIFPNGITDKRDSPPSARQTMKATASCPACGHLLDDPEHQSEHHVQPELPSDVFSPCASVSP